MDVIQACAVGCREAKQLVGAARLRDLPSECTPVYGALGLLLLPLLPLALSWLPLLALALALPLPPLAPSERTFVYGTLGLVPLPLLPLALGWLPLPLLVLALRLPPLARLPLPPLALAPALAPALALTLGSSSTTLRIERSLARRPLIESMYVCVWV